jgi:hypothetical protein
MKRVLLVTYHFPPEPSAGAQRPGYLARELPRRGWDVTVLTARREGIQPLPCRVFAAPVLGSGVERSVRGALGGQVLADPRSAGGLRRLLRHAREAIYFPDHLAGWIPPAIAVGLKVTQRERFDAVLSSAMPASVHVVAAAIAARRGLPWIADYRDPWSGNFYIHRGRLRGALEQRLERALLRCADAITAISEPVADLVAGVHHRSVRVIPNATDIGADSTTSLPESFLFCFTGSMDYAERSPDLLFAAIARLRKEGDPASRARVTFYGRDSGKTADSARRHGISDLVESRGVVSRDAALAAQRAASDLLVFLSMDSATTGEMGSKIWEYVAARRPVIAFGPPRSPMREWLREHDLGWFASNLDEAVESVRSAYRRYMAGGYETKLPPDVFTTQDLAAAFAQELDRYSAARLPDAGPCSAPIGHSDEKQAST